MSVVSFIQKEEWDTMSLEKKRSSILGYWRAVAAVTRGVDKRREVLKEIYITQNLDMPEIESYLERIYKKIIGGKEC